jgi:putative endonuclease
VDKLFYVYILASCRNGTLYVGVTSQLVQRVWQHKEGLADGFTKQYGLKTLVWYEQHDTAESAITREKQIKKWERRWKVGLIEAENPYWNDLYDDVAG